MEVAAVPAAAAVVGAAAVADAVADVAALGTPEASIGVAVGGKDWGRHGESWVTVRDRVAYHQAEEGLEDQWGQTDQDRWWVDVTVLGKGALALASEGLAVVGRHAVQVGVCLHVDHRGSVAEEEAPDHGSVPRDDSIQGRPELVEQDREEVAEAEERPTVVPRAH